MTYKDGMSYSYFIRINNLEDSRESFEAYIKERDKTTGIKTFQSEIDVLYRFKFVNSIF